MYHTQFPLNAQKRGHGHNWTIPEREGDQKTHAHTNIGASQQTLTASSRQNFVFVPLTTVLEVWRCTSRVERR